MSSVHEMSESSRTRSIGINIFLMVAAATVLYYQLSAAIDRRADTLRAGDRLPPLSGVDFSAHERTLVIAVRTGCPFVDRSMAFYRELAELRRQMAATFGLAVVSPDSEDVLRSLLWVHDLQVPAAPATSLSSLKLHSTPTVVLTDSTGSVLRFWEGELAASAQTDVLASIGRRDLGRPGRAADPWRR